MIYFVCTIPAMQVNDVESFIGSPQFCHNISFAHIAAFQILESRISTIQGSEVWLLQ
jgi:hypothetical protein